MKPVRKRARKVKSKAEAKAQCIAACVGAIQRMCRHSDMAHEEKRHVIGAIAFLSLGGNISLHITVGT